MMLQFTSQWRVQQKSWRADLRGVTQHIGLSDSDTFSTFHVCALLMSLLLALSLMIHVTHEAFVLALYSLCLR